MGQVQCAWCRMAFDAASGSCPRCGASVDVRIHADRSGWIEQPPVRDMAKVQMGASHAQIEGVRVPVVDVSLAEGDGIYMTHDKLLWHDGKVRMSNHKGGGLFKRLRAGLPLYMLRADGPGRIGLSDNHAGEIIIVPLAEGAHVKVREHHLLMATGNIEFDGVRQNIWYSVRNGDETETEYPLGMYVDDFHAAGGPGVLMLHGIGNIFTRHLAANESVDIAPHSLLAWMGPDPKLLMERADAPKSNSWLSTSQGWRHMLAVRMQGPGRVWVQSGMHGRTEEWRTVTNTSGVLFS
jgi:uncharacterized protein (AIM24 family)